MPDPRLLRVGDRVCFVALPEEWSREGHTVAADSQALMVRLIARRPPARIAAIDVAGYPVIEARLRARRRIHYHWWTITESTGWRLVKRRE